MHLFDDAAYSVSVASGDGSPIDGRRARRERSRAAIIDAVFELVRDGKIPPDVDAVAERAGVSVSSVFRSFDGLDDMQRHAFEVFAGRYSHLFEPTVSTSADRAERIAAHVRIRLDLFEAAGPIMAIARHRALDYAPMAGGVARSRSRLADQTRAHFTQETTQLTPAAAADLIATIDTITSAESYELMGATHSRTHRQISRTWIATLTSLLAGWPGLTDRESKT